MTPAKICYLVAVILFVIGVVVLVFGAGLNPMVLLLAGLAAVALGLLIGP